MVSSIKRLYCLRKRSISNRSQVKLYTCSGIPVNVKSRKEDPGNYRRASLTSVSENIIEQILLEARLRHTENGEVI